MLAGSPKAKAMSMTTRSGRRPQGVVLGGSGPKFQSRVRPSARWISTLSISIVVAANKTPLTIARRSRRSHPHPPRVFGGDNLHISVGAGLTQYQRCALWVIRGLNKKTLVASATRRSPRSSSSHHSDSAMALFTLSSDLFLVRYGLCPPQIRRWSVVSQSRSIH